MQFIFINERYIRALSDPSMIKKHNLIATYDLGLRFPFLKNFFCSNENDIPRATRLNNYTAIKILIFLLKYNTKSFYNGQTYFFL